MLILNKTSSPHASNLCLDCSDDTVANDFKTFGLCKFPVGTTIHFCKIARAVSNPSDDHVVSHSVPNNFLDILYCVEGARSLLPLDISFSAGPLLQASSDIMPICIL